MKAKKRIIISSVILSVIIITGAFLGISGKADRLVSLMLSGNNTATLNKSDEKLLGIRGADETTVVVYNETQDKSYSSTTTETDKYYESLKTALSEAVTDDVLVLKADIVLPDDSASRISISDGRSLTIKSDTDKTITLTTKESSYSFISLSGSSTLSLEGDIIIDGTGYGNSIISETWASAIQPAVQVTNSSTLSLNKVTLQNFDTIGGFFVTTPTQTGSPTYDRLVIDGSIINVSGTSNLNATSVTVTDSSSHFVYVTYATYEKETYTVATQTNDYRYAYTYTQDSSTNKLFTNLINVNASKLTGSTFNVSNCNAGRIFNNVSSGTITINTGEVKDGTGLAFYNGSSSTLSLEKVTVSNMKGNLTVGSKIAQPAVHADGTTVTLKNCTVTNNTCDYGVLASNSGTANLTGTTVSKCQPTGSYGLYVSNNSVAVLDGATIKENPVGVYLESTDTDMPTFKVKNKVTVSGNTSSDVWFARENSITDDGLTTGSKIGLRYKTELTETISIAPIRSGANGKTVKDYFFSNNTDYVMGYNDSNIVMGQKLTISFEQNLSTGEMADEYVCKGSYYTLPKCTFTKFRGKFDCWGTKSGYEYPNSGDSYEGVTKDYGKFYDEDETVMVTWEADEVFYARWTRYVAMIGDNMYMTLKEAFDAAQTTDVGTTIYVIDNCEVEDTITVSKDINLFIDVSYDKEEYQKYYVRYYEDGIEYTAYKINVDGEDIDIPEFDTTGMTISRKNYDPEDSTSVDNRNHAMFEITNGATLTTKGDAGGSKIIFEGGMSYSLETGTAFFKVVNGTLNLYECTEVMGCSNALNDSNATHKGGAVYACAGSKVNVQGANIMGNRALFGAGVYLEGSDTKDGGAILTVNKGSIEANGYVLTSESNFENNTLTIPEGTTLPANVTPAGAAIYAGKNTSVTIFEAQMKYNKANVEDKGVGAVLAAFEANVTINNPDIESNAAAGNGGAIYIEGGSVNMVGAMTLYKNRSTNGNGGAIYLKDCDYSFTNRKQKIVMDISGVEYDKVTKISENSARNGGAFYITGSSEGNITGCETTLNSVKYRDTEEEGNGGAIYLGTGSTLELKGTDTQRIDVTKNTAFNMGGAVYAANGSKLTVTACNMTGNRAEYIDPNGVVSEETPEDSTDTDTDTDTDIDTGEEEEIVPSKYAMGGAIYADGNITLGSSTISENHGELGGGVYVTKNANLKVQDILIIEKNEYNIALVSHVTEFNNLYVVDNSNMTSGGLRPGSKIYLSLNLDGKFYGTFMTNNDKAADETQYFIADVTRTLDDDEYEGGDSTAPSSDEIDRYIIGSSGKTMFVNREITISFSQGLSTDDQTDKTIPNMSYAYGAEFTLPANTFTYDGFTFSHWECDLQGYDKEYQPGETFTIPTDRDDLFKIMFTAVWTDNIAKVQNKFFTTIEEAIEYAGNKAEEYSESALDTYAEEYTVYILRSIELRKTLDINKTVIITSDGGFGFYRSQMFEDQTKPLISVNKNATTGVNGRLTLNNVFVTGNSMLSDSGMGSQTSSQAPLIQVEGTLTTLAKTVLRDNYNANTNGSDGYGGAVRVEKDGIYNCKESTITGNKAARGGAIYIRSTSALGELYLVGAKIYSNTATDIGGGIYVEGESTKVYIMSNTVVGGTDTEQSQGNIAYAGAGIYAAEGTINIYDAQIAYNKITEANKAAGYNCAGAGIYVEAATVIMNNDSSVIRKNQINALGVESLGVGVFVNYGSLVMYNGRIVDNVGLSNTKGAGVYTKKVITLSGDATINDNFAGGNKSNLYLASTQLIKMLNDSIGSQIGVTLNSSIKTGPLLAADSVSAYLKDSGKTIAYANCLQSDVGDYLILGHYNVANNLTSERNIYITKKIKVTYDKDNGKSNTIPESQVLYSNITNELYTTKDVTRKGYEIASNYGYWKSGDKGYDYDSRFIKPDNSMEDFTVKVQWSAIQINVSVSGKEFLLKYGSLVQTKNTDGSYTLGYELSISIENDAEDGPAVKYALEPVMGNLPKGLSLDGKRIMGTPSEVGDYPFSIKVTGRNGTSAYASFIVTVGDADGMVTVDSDISKLYDGFPAAYPKYTRLGTGEVTITFASTTGKVINDPNTPPTEAGEYEFTIYVAKDKYYNATSVTQKFTISKIDRGFTYRDFIQTKVYNGVEASVPPVYEQVYNALKGTYDYEFRWYDSETVALSDTTGANKRKTLPVDVGTYYVRMFVAGDENYNDTLSKVFKYTITQKPVDVIWENLLFTYDTQAHKPTAYFTDINNGKVYVEVVDYQTEQGTYTAYVTDAAKSANSNYNLLNPTESFTIIRADTTVKIITTPMTMVYNTKTPVLEYATVSDGVASFVWYDSEGNVIQPPTENGTYKVKVTVTQGHNYNATESELYTYTITPKPTDIVWSDLEFTYKVDSIVEDKEVAHTWCPTAYYTKISGEKVYLTVLGAQSQAGTYTAKTLLLKSEDGNYTFNNPTQTFKIAKLQGVIRITGDLSRDYNGQTVSGDKVTTWTGDGQRVYKYTDENGNVLNSAPKDSGKYTISVIMLEGKNYLGTGTYTDPVEFEIYKLYGEVQINSDAQFSKIYDDMPVSLYDQLGNKKYSSTGEGDIQVDWYTIGNELISSGIDEGAFTGVGANGPIEEGQYRVVLTLPDTRNYYGASDYTTFSITKIEGGVKITATLNKVYDGMPASLATLDDSGNIIDKGYEYIVPDADTETTIDIKWYDKDLNMLESAPINAGNYTVKVTQILSVKVPGSVDENGNPKIYETESTDIAAFTIARAQPKFSAPENQSKIYDGDAFSLNYNIVSDGQVYVAWYRNTEKLEFVPYNAGEYMAYISAEQGENYVALSLQKVVVTIEKATPVITPISTIESLSKPYDGEPINSEDVEFTYTGDGRASVVWYNESSQLSSPPVDAGAYIAKIVISETDNYNSATLDIGKVNTTEINGINEVDTSEMIIISKLSGKITLIDTNIDKIYDGFGVSAPRCTTTGGDVSITWYDKEGNEIGFAPSVVGEYSVKLTLIGNTNWIGAEESLNFKITPKTVNATFTDIIREYSGSTAVTINEGEYELDDILKNDVVYLKATGNFSDKNVITSGMSYMRVTIDSMTLTGPDSGNYVLGETTASILGTITTRRLSITPDPYQYKEELQEDPEITYVADGLVEGDVIKGKLSREQGEEVGSYFINIGTLDPGTNYFMTFDNNVLFTIKPRPTYNIHITTLGSGTVSPNDISTVTKNESQTYEFIPTDGWLVGEVKVDSEDKGVIYSYEFKEVQEDHDLYVVFAKDVAELKVTEKTHSTVTLDWNIINGCAKMVIERSTDGVNFEEIATVEGESTGYVDENLRPKTTYYYRAMPYFVNGDSADEYYYTNIVSVETELLAPVLVSAKSDNYNAITITWKKSDGAEGYKVYRYDDAANAWKEIADVVGENTLSYTDKTVKNGETYKYTVRAYVTSINGIVYSDFDEAGKSAKAMPANPTVTSVKASGRTNVVIKWSAVSGADKYRVYRSETGATSGFSVIASVASGTLTYTDTDRTEGKTYYYTVLAVRDGVYGKYNDGISVTLIPATPKISAVTNSAYNKLKVSWGKLSDCDGYILYRSLKESSGWSRVANISDPATVTYTDTVPDCGVTYYYTIRAYWKTSSGYVYGKYNTGVGGNTLPTTPAIKKVTSAGYNSLKITWDEVTEAHGYRLYRSETKTGGWKAVKDITPGTTTLYKNTKLTTGKTYYYTLRAFVIVDGKMILSGYVKTGVGGTPIPATPKISSAVKSGAKQITLTWGKITGATGYRIYRSLNESTDYSTVAIIRNNATVTYTDETAVPGTQYYYTIRAYTTVDGTNIYSECVKPGIAGKTTLATPNISSATATGYNSITVKWGKIAGVDTYTLYRSTTQTGGWKSIATVKGDSTTSYVDTTAVYNKQYYYTVRANLTIGDDTYRSGYNTTGTAGKATAVVPNFSVASASYDSIKLTWTAVGQADGYVIYRSLNSDNTGWKVISTIEKGSTVSYIDKDVECGKTYYYTMRSFKTIDGTKVTSGYLKNGKSCTAKPSTPVVTALQQQDKTVFIEWNKIDGAVSYKIYRKISGGSWSVIGTEDGDTVVFMDETAEEDVPYIYTVRAISSNNIYSAFTAVNMTFCE